MTIRIKNTTYILKSEDYNIFNSVFKHNSNKKEFRRIYVYGVRTTIRNFKGFGDSYSTYKYRNVIQKLVNDIFENYYDN